MQQPRSNEAPAKALAARLDRWAGELNAFLLVFGMGLGVLYGTCLFGMKLDDAILHTGPIGELSATQQISAMVR